MRTFCLALAVSAFIIMPSFAQEPTPDDKTLLLVPPEGAIVLIGDSIEAWTDADGKSPAGWPVADGVATVGKGNIRTKEKFGDFAMHLEFNIPYMPEAKGQARGNSGVYLQGIYELQVLDSYGLKPQSNDCGAIYQQIIPAVNACKPPLRWQTYDITFHAARREGDKVVRKARLTVVQNGLTIIDDKEISPTPGGVGDVKEGELGPIMLQDHSNAVKFRNVWIKPVTS
ncbi:3-keto-disaccharide hydrolase [Tundrisphaera lichenicola]|uniref:3-keto-disaccharide hydrolase n=1 Tax=Tundrisphaera lichenicola TaxID=2029860 RepID=UPI003EBAD7C5